MWQSLGVWGWQYHCVCVCVCVCVCLCLCVCTKRGRGDIHFGKAQQLCMPPSMFGLLLCIFMEG